MSSYFPSFQTARTCVGISRILITMAQFCYLRLYLAIESVSCPATGSRRSTFEGNSALFPSDVIDFVIFPAQRFWRETVSLLDVM